MKKKIKICFVLVFLTIGTVQAQQWTLEKCQEYAMQNNKKLIAAEQKTEAASYGKKGSKSKLIPEINLQGDMNYYWQIPVQVFPGELVGQPGKSIPVRMGTPWMSTIGASASWDIVNPKLWSEIKLSALKEQLANENAASLEQLLKKNVAMAFFQSQLLQEAVKLSNKRLDNYRKVHYLIKKKLEKGLVDKIDFNQSLGILESLKNTLLKQELKARKVLLSLKFWMGYPLKDSLDLAFEESSTSLVNQAFNPKALPNYEKQLLQLQIAKQKYKATKADLYPKLSIVGGYSKLGFGQQFDFITQSKWFSSGYIGLQLSIPISSFSKMVYQPQQQKALIKSQQSDLGNFVQQQKQHFLQKQIEVETLEKIVLSKQKQLQLAKENVHLSYQKIQKGIIDMMELNQVQQNMNEALQNLNKAKLNLIENKVELKYLQQ